MRLNASDPNLTTIRYFVRWGQWASAPRLCMIAIGPRSEIVTRDFYLRSGSRLGAHLFWCQHACRIHQEMRHKILKQCCNEPLQSAVITILKIIATDMFTRASLTQIRVPLTCGVCLMWAIIYYLEHFYFISIC